MLSTTVSNFLDQDSRHDVFLHWGKTEKKPAKLNAALLSADAEIRSLCIWNAGKFDSSLLRRFTRLERLTIFVWPDATLDALGKLRTIRELALMDIPKTCDLRPLAKLTRLEQIELAPLASSTRPQTVPSLRPLRSLRNLRVLRAGRFLAEDRNATFFERMAPMNCLILGDWLTLDQYARLVVQGHKMPSIVWDSQIESCRKCSGTHVYLSSIAKRRKRYCSGCHADLIAAHQAEFDELVARLRSARSRSSKP